MRFRRQKPKPYPFSPEQELAHEALRYIYQCLAAREGVPVRWVMDNSWLQSLCHAVDAQGRPLYDLPRVGSSIYLLGLPVCVVEGQFPKLITEASNAA